MTKKPLNQELADEPYRFEFFQAVRLLEQLIQQDRTQVSVVALDTRRLKEVLGATGAPLFSELLSRVTTPVVTPARVNVNTRLPAPSSAVELGATATDTSVSSLTIVPVALLGSPTL